MTRIRPFRTRPMPGARLGQPARVDDGRHVSVLSWEHVDFVLGAREK